MRLLFSNMEYLLYFLIVLQAISINTVVGQEGKDTKNLDNGDKNQSYENAIAKGNTAIGEQNYKNAIAFFTDALKYKPKDSYALYQLRFAQNLFEKDSLLVVEKNRRTAQQIKERARIDRFNRSMGAYSNYENAAQLGNFEDQILYLKEFLNTMPDTSELNEYQANFTAKIDFSRKKLKAIRDYLTRTKGSWYQPEALPYTDAEFKAKYPNLNFKKIPVGQKMDVIDSSGLVKVTNKGKMLLKEAPRLNISDSSAKIKIACQAVNVEDDNLYCKFSVRNYDTTDFLTGPLQLKLLKKDKSITALSPVYVSDFPVILPQKEFFIVYVSKAVNIGKSDRLTFELEDLFRTKKLEIEIPGELIDKETKKQF